MPYYLHQDALDAELLHTIDRADRVVLLSDYSEGDSWATVQGNIVCEVTITPGVAGPDFSAISTVNTHNRACTFQGASGTASVGSGAAPNSHVGLLSNANSEVLRVTNEVNNQEVFQDNPVTFDAWTFEARQPVQL